MKFKLLRFYLLLFGGGKERFFIAIKPALYCFLTFALFSVLFLSIEKKFSFPIRMISMSLLSCIFALSYYYFFNLKAVHNFKNPPNTSTRFQKRLYAFDIIILKKLGIFMLFGLPLMTNLLIIYKVSTKVVENRQIAQIQKEIKK